MRYRAECSLTDFDGRFYQKGEVVELAEGKHSTYLTPLDQPEVTVTTAKKKRSAGKKKQAGA